MDKIVITNPRQAIALINNEKLNFRELLSLKINEVGISQNKLAEKMSDNEQNPDEIDPRTIRAYLSGKRKTQKVKRLKAFAEALGTTHYEFQPDHALVNADRDELPDDEYYWRESIENIRHVLRALPAQQAILLCKSYRKLLSVPSETIATASIYSYLDTANLAQFSTYMGVLLNESHSVSLSQYLEIFDMLEKISPAQDSEVVEWLDLFQLLKTTFPDKENTEDAEAFYQCLCLLLNQNYREIVKSCLLLDSDIKREMILRIADQMLTVQKEANA